MCVFDLPSLFPSSFLSNKKQARKQETFYLDEIDKTENSMKLASTTNGASQRSASTASAAKSAAPEGKASAGLYSKGEREREGEFMYMYVNVVLKLTQTN